MTPHPILDRSPAVRANADAMGLSCPDTEYVGWKSKYRFVCAAGHLRVMSLHAVVSGVHRCLDCMGDGFLQRLRDAAAAIGHECLDTVWRGATGTYRFRCGQGHEWTRCTPGRFGTDHAVQCTACVAGVASLARRADKLVEIRAAAVARGGACLTETYPGDDAPLQLRCAQGHEWQTPGSSLSRGTWCPRCARIEGGRQTRLQDGLKRLQQAAAKQGGTLLSETYHGSRQRYAVRCAAGHEWEARGSLLMNGNWCRTCVSHAAGLKRRLANGLEALREAARAQGGECLATVYEGAAHRYLLRCAQGHEWENTGAALRKGSWCVECMYARKRLSIEDARETARARGGECLSQTYVNTSTPMSWLCHQGHMWSARLGNIRSGKWCPECAHIALIAGRKSKARRRHGVSMWHGATDEPTANKP